jgi:hypothetical protein
LTIGTGRWKELATIEASALRVRTVRVWNSRRRFGSITPPGSMFPTMGTGIRFSPATKFAHTSGDAVQALGSGVTLDSALSKNHPYGAPDR